MRNLVSAFERFQKDKRGTVVVIMAISIIPVMGMVGAGVDYSRASSAGGELQNALDSAILTVAHQRELDEDEAAAYIEDQVLALIDEGHGAHDLTVEVAQGSDENLLEVSASLQVDTSLLKLMGVETIEVGAHSAVSVEISALEVALVLDNTGSMRFSNRIGSLREAAEDFVDVVTEDGTSNNVKISLVPYTAQVNIGNSLAMEQYLDKQGLSQHHAQLIEGQLIARRSNRSRSCDSEISGLFNGNQSVEFAGGGERSGLLDVPGFGSLSFLDAYSDFLRELIGVTAANAQSVTPYAYVRRGPCIYNPTQISHWQLYQQLEGVDWKGCVEARPEPFDVTDTPPSSQYPDTLWVPGFWIDDSGSDSTNNWLSDRPRNNFDFREDGAHYSVYKYASSSGHSVDEVPNTTLGPAQNCGDPIVPLTDNFSMIQDRIGDMTYWRGGGTVTAQGVAWGWRTLSPEAPFSEGEPYGDVNKVMVVMTDGENELVSSDNSALGSEYSAYGHLETGRFPSKTISSARSYIDDRTLAACANAKQAGIVVYTVTFGLDADAQAMWDTCATDQSMAYHVDTASELVDAFNVIAGSVGDLRLTR